MDCETLDRETLVELVLHLVAAQATTIAGSEAVAAGGEDLARAGGVYFHYSRLM